jgi:hypothetical protein
MGLIVKILLAVLIGLLVFWILGWLGLPHLIAVTFGLIAGIVAYFYG